MGSRVRFWAVVATAMAATFTPLQEPVSAQSGPGIVISEFRLAGPRGTNDEFVELFNAGQTPVNVSAWTIRSANNINFSGGVSNTFLRATLPANVVIQPGCYYLVANNGTNGYIGTGTAAADLTYATGIADDGGVAVVRSNGTIADQVGFVNTATGNGFTAYFEGTKIGVTLPLPAQDRSYERKPNQAFVYQDTNDNANDFATITPSRPQNKTATCASVFNYPHDIQGAGDVSPLASGTTVNVKGVVTGLKADGFFMQTEAVNEDADAATSEGLFVSFAGAVQAGHLVVVTGKVAEFKPAADPASATRTQIEAVSNIVDFGAATLPAPVALTAAELSDAGPLDQLERFEGMRVSVAQLSAVTGSDLDGAFYAVLTGQPRPFREPGVHASTPVLPCAVAPCNVPVFDGNPELLRLDADGLNGVALVPVSTGVVLNNVTGSLDFSSRAYTLLPGADLAPAPGSGMSIVAAAAHADDQFTVASLNLGASYPARLAKASLALRNVLNYPDVVGVEGVDTVGDLAALAAQVNADAAGAAHYDAYPSTGDAADTLGVGFLVRSARVSSPEATQLAGTPFDHAPVVLRATLHGPATRLPQDVTVIVSRFASQADVARADAAGDAARLKRQAQADFLAAHIQGLQIGDPNAAIVALGDYNAFDFNDGFVDVVGTVRGVPAPADQVVLASPAVVFPALFNPEGLNAWPEQYSSLSDGSAQSLDHVLVSASLSARLVGLVHARINADFPHALASDDSTPVRLSDRDPLVVYFTFPPDVDGPVFEPVADVAVEATGAAGAVVTFATPQADDNLDETVIVSCNPMSGTQFALGNTGVTCSAQDAAGNPSAVSFTVSVQDTTAPLLAVPDDQMLEAASAAGASFNFTATATDAVTAALTVTCSSSSGVFPLGTTNVSCSTQDASGNTASASFNVKVQDTTAPLVSVPASIVAEASSAAGRAVTFNASASDAVTTALMVACSPASGSVFPLGTTSVSCSADDTAGNHGSASFSVTVRDTTPPVLTVPANVTAEATSVSGRVVTFTASATDAVTVSPAVSCAPASGSTFPIGTTSVGCAATDAAGNRATGSFTVTITAMPATTDGHMFGDGEVGSGNRRLTFAFNLRESTKLEPRWVALTFRDGQGGPDRFTSLRTDELRFSSSTGGAIDTVFAKGVGNWNGVDGYRFELTGVDRGSPGRDLDTFAATIYAPNGAVVATSSGALHNGEIQTDAESIVKALLRQPAQRLNKPLK